jgi:hypothetical protein
MTCRLPTLTALAALALAAPAALAEGNKGGATPYVHTVIFYLKADAPSSTADEILADCHEILGKISTVRALKAGRPAPGSSFPTKSDYAVGLLVLFDDAEGFKKYASDPLHLKFIGKHRQHLDLPKLAIYDFVDAKK